MQYLRQSAFRPSHCRQTLRPTARTLVVSGVLALLFLASLFSLKPSFAQPQTPPDLTLRKTHSSDFPIGFMGRYEIVVSNAASAGTTTGPITVTDNLPANLGLSFGFGAGWSCTGTTNVTCTHAGPLAAGASLPTLQLNVTVGFGTPAGTNSITNTASVSTPGETNTANNTATDPTTVLKRASQIALGSVTPNPATNCHPLTVSFTASNPGLGGPPTSGTVTVTDGVNSCTGTLNNSPSGSCALTLTTLGTRSLTATYAGNADFEGSTSAPVMVQVAANSPPVLGTYTAQSVVAGSSLTVSPTAPPTDNSAITSVTVVSPGIVPFLGTLSVEPATGVVTINNARPTGSFPIRVTATDDCGATTSAMFTLTVVCPGILITPPSLPVALPGMAYNTTLTGTRGLAPYTFSVVSGTLPTGLTLASNGVLSGTHNQTGTFMFTVKATDANGCMATVDYTLITTCPTLTLNPSALPDAMPGVAYALAFTATGGTSPYSYSLQSGTLPDGFTLNSLGNFVGTPSRAGSFTFTIQASDRYSCAITRTYTLNIPCPAVAVAPAALPNGIIGRSYSEKLSISFGNLPFNFTLQSGALPRGLTLAADGTLAGTPTQTGVSTFTVKGTDGYGCMALREYALTIVCPVITVNPATLNGGFVGAAYYQKLSASGGAAPYVFSLQSGALPNGLALQADELLGILNRPGNFSFVIKATDANGCTVLREYSLLVECNLVLQPDKLPVANLGAAYSQMLTISGGVTGTTYSFSLMNGMLPNGLTLTANGLLSGTTTQLGSFAFTVKATGSNGCTATRDYTLSVRNCPVITVSPTETNITYTTVFTASGGATPYTFSLVKGMLPYGLNFSSEGRFTGFPLSSGVFPFTIKATDANGCSGMRNYVLDLSLRPGISNLIPSAVLAGRGAFTLTVNGSNFLNNATLSWNGAARPTTVVSSTQLRAEITAADVAQAGAVLLTVTNPPPFGSISHMYPFTIYPSNTRFEADVWPRRDGDGAVDAADIRQQARYVLKLDSLPTGNEFQRADCDPGGTKGDGRLTLADVVQTLRYANGLGVLTAVGGPTVMQAQPDESAPEEWQAQPGGQLSARGGELPRGQISALEIQLNATGNETAASFTLHYDSTRLTFLDIVKADFFSSAEVFVNDTQPGKVGIIFLLPVGQKLEGGPTTLLSLRFLPNGGAGSEAVAFTFSDELAARAAVGVSAGELPQQTLTSSNSTSMVTGAAPAFLSAASFTGGATLASNSVSAAFGTNLTTMNATATSLPLPTTLGGTTVTITDRTNTQHTAPLFFVSPSQINFLLPASVAEGAAFVTIRTSTGTMASGIIRINAVAPGVFAAAANGRGLAAAQFLRVRSDGTQRYEPVARFDPMTRQFVAVPFEFAPAGEEVFLVLYGTGLRGRSLLTNVSATLGGIPAEVLYVGNQGGLAGLDQVNLRLPHTLAGRGEVEIVLTVDGRVANSVRVNFK